MWPLDKAPKELILKLRKLRWLFGATVVQGPQRHIYEIFWLLISLVCVRLFLPELRCVRNHAHFSTQRLNTKLCRILLNETLCTKDAKPLHAQTAPAQCFTFPARSSWSRHCRHEATGSKAKVLLVASLLLVAMPLLLVASCS